MLGNVFETPNRLLERAKGTFEAHHHQPAHKVIQVALLKVLKIFFFLEIF